MLLLFVCKAYAVQQFFVNEQKVIVTIMSHIIHCIVCAALARLEV
jgi:hypothetical protein